MRSAPRRALGPILLWLHAAPALGSSSNSAAAAEPTPPYRAWPGARIEAPLSPPPFERAPAPEAESPELARRVFELGAEFAVGVPHCAGHAESGCPLLDFGTEIAATLLGRPSPYFALGGSARRFAFEVGANANRARATQLFLGFDARAYFLESGPFDPYLTLGLGGGPLTWLSERDGGRIEEKVAFAAGVRSAGGIDVLFDDWFRLGAFLAVTRYFPSSASRCDSGVCVGQRPGSSSFALGATSLGLRLTFTAGEGL